MTLKKWWCAIMGHKTFVLLEDKVRGSDVKVCSRCGAVT